MLPKDGVRPQLKPKHEIECLSPSQAELLYEYMEEHKALDPVKLDLCKYQAKEPVHPFSLLREDHDSIVGVSPHEALVIKDASRIGAIESLPNPEPQQDTQAANQIPRPTPETQAKIDYIFRSG